MRRKGGYVFVLGGGGVQWRCVMHERFREGWRAAAYVGGGLQCDFHDAMVEVTYTYHDQSIRRLCHTTEVGNVIEEFCKDFPQATVCYDREAYSGYIAEVRCHCPQEKAQGCCRNGHHHRAKVHVSIVKTQVSSAESTPPREATQNVAFGG